MNTVALKKADGIVKMVVLADESGSPLRMTKSEATLLAMKTENASVSKDNYSSTPVYDKRGRYVKSVNASYFVRIKT